MNSNIQNLYNISNKSSRRIIGLMSGTSLDGLDIACCSFDGTGRYTTAQLEIFKTVPYSEAVKRKLCRVVSKEKVDFAYLAMLNEWIGLLHAEMVNDFLKENNLKSTEIDAIASHGQTVMHVPKSSHSKEEYPNATLQIGDGDHIAVRTGILTLSDFRQKHLAGGGEGAPLAVYGDYILFSKKGENRIMLNLGGIGNFTYLPGNGDASSVFVTDTGPANILMDVWMRANFNNPYDKNGSLASKGKVLPELLAALKNNSFFRIAEPKTTGHELFNLSFIESAIKESGIISISHENMLATLNRLSAETVCEAILSLTGYQQFKIYLSGGGAHNTHLVSSIKELLPHCNVLKFDTLGISGDAKEALLFAVLANETIAGNIIDFGQKHGVPKVFMGKISFPN